MNVETFESGKKKVVDTKISGCMWTGPKTRRRMTTAITEFPTKMTLVHAGPLLGIEKFSYSLCLGFLITSPGM